MAKERSEESRFPSKFGGGWISASQFITECLCILIARQQKKQLCDRFWMRPPWNKIFREQIPAAVNLLKDYDTNVIIAALRDKRCWNMRSLRAMYILKPILDEKATKQSIIDNIEPAVMQKTNTIQQPVTKQTDKKSIISLLRETENDARPN
jgi:hypothetical protein